MTKEELIRIATEYAAKEGWQVENYLPSFEQKKNECRVGFEGKSKRPGDHFAVYLDCKTGKVLRLIPGR